jgi:hypothetical protein
MNNVYKLEESDFPLTSDGVWPFPSENKLPDTQPKTLQESLDSLPDAPF